MDTQDWTSSASEEAKRELIGKDWGDEVDTYLWYEIGDVSRLTKEEFKAIVAECFLAECGIGDLELHASQNLRGSPTLLRLRGKLWLRPALTIRGRYCPLYQVGHGGSGLFDPSSDNVNFYEQWKEAA